MGGRDGLTRIDHLCKYPLTHPPTPLEAEYVEAIKTLGKDENVYMKLSGAFNEFTKPSKPPSTTGEMADALTPVLDIVFQEFHGRIMFGSDWPVCNVGGPAGESKNWGFWRDVVSEIGQRRGLSDDKMQGIWSRVGAQVYGVEL
jgi:predicted TIM-barrel fold metal-dependent hydrolase